jgi:hypothetical protein
VLNRLAVRLGRKLLDRFRLALAWVITPGLAWIHRLIGAPV